MRRVEFDLIQKNLFLQRKHVGSVSFLISDDRIKRNKSCRFFGCEYMVGPVVVTGLKGERPGVQTVKYRFCRGTFLAAVTQRCKRSQGRCDEHSSGQFSLNNAFDRGGQVHARTKIIENINILSTSCQILFILFNATG